MFVWFYIYIRVVREVFRLIFGLGEAGILRTCCQFVRQMMRFCSWVVLKESIFHCGTSVYKNAPMSVS